MIKKNKIKLKSKINKKKYKINHINKKNNINFYIRTKNLNFTKLATNHFEKIDINILTTNKEWKTLYYFKNNYNPIQEEYYYFDGGYFVGKIKNIPNNILYGLVNNLLKLIKKNKFLVGIRIRTGKNFFLFEIWSIFNYNSKDKNTKNINNMKNTINTKKKISSKNDDSSFSSKKFSLSGSLIELPKNDISKKYVEEQIYFILKNYLLTKKIKFTTFYSLPITDDNSLSLIKLRNKYLYYLRFDSVLGKILHTKKIWWEIYMLKYFMKYYKKNTNVIDIGANIGSHTLLLSEIVSPNNKIYSFEPVYADIVEKNVKANHLNNVVIFNEGVGKKNEEINIDIFNRNCPINFGKFSLINNYKNPTSLSKNTLNKCKPSKKNIKIVTLDSKKLNNISLIKIDVEGMELDVLEGAIETIKNNRPTIFIEIWGKHKNKYLNHPIFKKIIIELKYEILYIEESYIGSLDYILSPL
jgi:FkbM family methyltransferase